MWTSHFLMTIINLSLKDNNNILLSFQQENIFSSLEQDDTFWS